MRAYTELSGSNLRAALIGGFTVDLRRSCEALKNSSEGERRGIADLAVSKAFDRLGIPYQRAWWER